MRESARLAKLFDDFQKDYLEQFILLINTEVVVLEIINFFIYD
jgi:hypothetical protein